LAREEIKHRRFRVCKESIQGREAVIEDRGEIRHMSKVLRLGVGDRVTLFDGEGREYQAFISSLSPQRVFFTLSGEPILNPRESSVRIALGAAVLKASRFDWLLQKTTELGVSEILPFYSRHVIIRREEDQEGIRQARWQKIVSEAAKQCGRSRIPQIRIPRSFAETLAVRIEGAAKIFLQEREKTRGLKHAMDKSSGAIFVLVGPEGGFSEDEVMQAREAGFCPVGLGPRILRAETAGILVVGLLQFLLGDLG
jgi:16S rRNA (uracil1498-N3)-methyltransferase